MRRPNLFKFNLLLFSFFGALFGSIAAVFSAPILAGFACAAALVWGYDIIAGTVIQRMDRDEREAEIRAQTSITNRNLGRICTHHGSCGADRAMVLASREFDGTITDMEREELNYLRADFQEESGRRAAE